MGVMLMYPYIFDVALCGIKVKYAARSLSLVGHPLIYKVDDMIPYELSTLQYIFYLYKVSFQNT